MAEELAPEVREFIEKHIASVEQLEILCLVAKVGSKVWSAADVFKIIQSSEASVLNCLHTFVRQGLLVGESEGVYRFSPGAPGLGQVVAAVAQAYQERPVRVIEFIYSKTPDAVRDFADAFRVRKEK